MADVSVRPARSDDVDDIARIQLETWTHGYAEILPAPVLGLLTAEVAQQAWGEAVMTPPTPRHHVLVALEQEWRVGFVAFGPADDLEETDVSPATTVAFGPLLVEPRFGRRGHASRLMSAAVDHARGDGMDRAVIWIPEADNASREFLVGAGWAPDGLARALDTGDGELREIRLHVSLAA